MSKTSNIGIVKIIFSILVAAAVILLMHTDVYAYRTNVSGVGNCINSAGNSANTRVSGVGNCINSVGNSINTRVSGVGNCINNIGSNENLRVSGTGNNVEYIARSMQEARELVENIRVSGVGNIITIKCTSIEIREYINESVGNIRVSGVQNSINVVMDSQQPQPTSQPQEVVPSALPQLEQQPQPTQPVSQPVEGITSTPKKDDVQPTPDVLQNLDDVPDTADNTNIKPVLIIFAISIIVMVMTIIVKKAKYYKNI